MLYNIPMTGQDSYDYTKSNPTKLNIQKFLLDHKPYIGSIVARYLHNNRNDIDDITSEAYAIMLSRGNLDFSRSYSEIKGYMALTAQRECQRFLEKKYLKYETNNVDDWFWNKQSDHPKQESKNYILVSELKKYCRPHELKIFNMYLSGKRGVNIGQEFGFSRQYVKQILLRFGRKHKYHYDKYKKEMRSV